MPSSCGRLLSWLLAHVASSAPSELQRLTSPKKQSRLQAERATELLAARVISKQEFENAIAAQKVSLADVAAAKAAVQAA